MLCTFLRMPWIAWSLNSLSCYHLDILSVPVLFDNFYLIFTTVSVGFFWVRWIRQWIRQWSRGLECERSQILTLCNIKDFFPITTEAAVHNMHERLRLRRSMYESIWCILCCIFFSVDERLSYSATHFPIALRFSSNVPFICYTWWGLALQHLCGWCTLLSTLAAWLFCV